MQICMLLTSAATCGQPKIPSSRAWVDDLILSGTGMPRRGLAPYNHRARFFNLLALCFRAFPLDFADTATNSCWPSKSDSCPPALSGPTCSQHEIPCLAAFLVEATHTNSPPLAFDQLHSFQNLLLRDQPSHRLSCSFFFSNCGGPCTTRPFEAIVDRPSLVFWSPPSPQPNPSRSVNRTSRPLDPSTNPQPPDHL